MEGERFFLFIVCKIHERKKCTIACLRQIKIEHEERKYRMFYESMIIDIFRFCS